MPNTPATESSPIAFFKAHWIWFAGPLVVMLVGALVIWFLLSDSGQLSEGNVPYELI